VRLGALSPVVTERGNYLVLNALPFGAPRTSAHPRSYVHIRIDSHEMSMPSHSLPPRVLRATAEDVRTYDFAPLPAEPKFEPSEEASAAAERLIDAMMFKGGAGAVGTASGADAFAATGDPRTVYNPTLRCVCRLRAALRVLVCV
jgi:hypothetical protein